MFKNFQETLLRIPSDKWAHFTVSLILSLLLVALCAFFGLGTLSFAIGPAVTFIGGWAKELWDKKNGVYDKIDIVYNFLGVFASFMVGALLLISFGVIL